MQRHQVNYFKSYRFHVIRKCTIIFISLLVSVLICMDFFNTKLAGIYSTIANQQVNKISSAIVNQAIKKCVTTNLDSKEIIVKNANNEGVVSSVEFDVLNINTIVSNLVLEIYDMFITFEKGSKGEEKETIKNGIVYEIPFGMAFQNPLLANLGPPLPVRFTLIGDINENIVSRISQYGINNVLIEVVSEITIQMQVLLPLISKIEVMHYDVPLAILSINGTVPTYYQGNKEIGSESFVVPLN